MHAKVSGAIAAWAAASALFLAPQASAQDGVADFYKGKQITIFVGFAPGGGYDAYARLLAQHMGKYIPGAPSLVVKNMFGAAGELAASFVANAAPKDGTAIVAVAASQPLARIFIPANQRTYDPARQHYLGSAAKDTYVCLVRRDAPAQTASDLFEKELILGAGAPGSGSLSYMPNMEQNLLATKVKLVVGYKGSREIVASMEKGEVHGLCGLNLSSINSQFAHYLQSGFARILVQESVRGDATLNAAGVPRMYNFAKTDTQKKIMETIYAEADFARPFFVAGGVPADRVAALRSAFLAALDDKALLADADKLQLPVDPSPGSLIQAVATDVAEQPESFIDEVRASLNPR
ncbi:MAG: efflux transporter protein [Hyphomicrobiales bacterium]|nr:efflux transporter protein [Hyphomicrobiales bacterium]